MHGDIFNPNAQWTPQKNPEIRHLDVSDLSIVTWALQMNLLLPACNSLMDNARGCLFGPPSTLFGGSCHTILNVWHIVYDTVHPHLPNTSLLPRSTAGLPFRSSLACAPPHSKRAPNLLLPFLSVVSTTRPGTLSCQPPTSQAPSTSVAV
jgi:hypothetical protein